VIEYKKILDCSDHNRRKKCRPFDAHLDSVEAFSTLESSRIGDVLRMLESSA